MFNEIKSWIIGNGIGLAWGFIYPLFVKLIWNNLIGLRIFAIIAFILGFVVIWQAKKIKNLQDEIVFLTPPAKSKRELLEDGVLLYICNNQKDSDFTRLDNSVDLLKGLMRAGFIKENSFEFISLKGIYYPVLLVDIKELLTLEGQERFEQIKKERGLIKNYKNSPCGK